MSNERENLFRREIDVLRSENTSIKERFEALKKEFIKMQSERNEMESKIENKWKERARSEVVHFSLFFPPFAYRTQKIHKKMQKE